MTLKIQTNHIPRATLTWGELSEKEQKEFDYKSAPNSSFVLYKGTVYDLGQFTRAEGPGLEDWDGLHEDTYFSGILVKYCEDMDWVVMGWYYESNT